MLLSVLLYGLDLWLPVLKHGLLDKRLCVLSTTLIDIVLGSNSEVAIRVSEHAMPFQPLTQFPDAFIAAAVCMAEHPFPMHPIAKPLSFVDIVFGVFL